MVTPKTAKPNPNLLDLRKIVTDRQAAAVQRKPRFSTLRPAKKQAVPKVAFHRPPAPPRDWLVFRRESLKFFLVLVVAGLLTGGVIEATRLAEAKTSVANQAHGGLDSLQAGLASLGQSQTSQASQQFTAAAEKFRQAQQTLNSAAPGWFDGAPLVGSQLAVGRRLLKDAEEFATLGQRLSILLPAHQAQQPAMTIESTGIISGSVGVLTSLLQHRPEFVDVVSQAVALVGDLETISPSDVPVDMRARFAAWQRVLTGLVGSKDTLEQITSFLIGFLAPAQPREYLVVFQNNDELRPTGGFLGTYLLVKFEQGTFKILDAPGNGPFSLSDESAKQNLPPQPILAVAPYWTFHDANWYLDAPTSAATMMKFYAQDRGFTPDGVVFMTPGIMEDILRLTGPIRPEHYQVDITAENFVKATEQQVEFGYDKALNNPKQFLIDLVPLMLTKLSQLSSPDALRAIALTLQRANQGDLMFVSSVPDVQQAAKALGWDGALWPVKGDAMAVVDTNLGGGKTDRAIDETVNLAVTLDGSILHHEVSVTRKNNSLPTNQYNSFANRTFIRVYAPPDAQFVSITGATIPEAGFFQVPSVTAKLSADLLQNEGQTLVDDTNGYRITHETGRTVFGAWSRINSGQSQTVIFTYTTPAPNQGQAATWHLDWQHQPGATLRLWNVEFLLPSGKQVSSVSPGGKLSSHNRMASFTSDSTLSRSFSVTYN